MAEGLGGLSPDRPVLLVADQAIDASGGGAVILHSLLDDLLGRGICWASPSHSSDDPSTGRYALRQGSLGRKGRRSLFADSFVYRRRLTHEVLELAARLNARAVWFVMHGSCVQIAAGVVRTGKLPVHLTVHDDPIHATAMRSRQLFPLTPLIARDFRYAMKRAASIDVVSAGMAQRYERLYGAKAVLLHRGLEDPVDPSPPLDLELEGLTIGLLGNTYAFAQLPVLAEALIGAAREMNLPARLLVLGAGFGERLRREFAGRLQVECLGHVSEAAAIERLRRCALLYLNYPFTRWCKVLRETSFPTKLSTYVYAARPLLAHAPEGTSIGELNRFGDYVLPWHSLDPEVGARLIADYLRVADSRRSFAREAEQVRRTYYDYAAQRATLDLLLRRLGRTGD